MKRMLSCSPSPVRGRAPGFANPPNGGFLPYGLAARGFTLVELIAVIVLLGILAAVSLPRLTSTGFDERAFRDRVAMALRYAQKMAIAARLPVCATFSTATTTASFRIADTFDAADCTSGGVLPGVDGQPLIVSASSGITFSAAPATLIFDAAGRPSAAAVIGVTGLAGAQAIIVEAETGYVH